MVCTFLSLPRELRDEVYEHALLFSGQIILQHNKVRFEEATHDFEALVHSEFVEFSHWTPGNTSHLDNALRPSSWRPSTAFLATCKLIYAEASEILSAKNKFTVFSRRGDVGESFEMDNHYGVVESLSKHAVPVIQQWLPSLRQFEQLRRLTIHIHPWPFFQITLPFLRETIIESKQVLTLFPALQKLRVIMRVGSCKGSLNLDIHTKLEHGTGEFNLVRCVTKSHEQHLEDATEWLAARLSDKLLETTSDKVELRLIHKHVQEEQDAMVLTNALRRARDKGQDQTTVRKPAKMREDAKSGLKLCGLLCK